MMATLRIKDRAMPRRTTTDRLELLRQKRDQLDAQLKALEARKKQAERKADTRRKVIAGALALEHFEKNPDSEFGRSLFRLLDEYVVRPHDRALFPDLPNPDIKAAQTGEPEPGAEFARAGRETAAPSPAP
jgi:hypothetical protein